VEVPRAAGQRDAALVLIADDLDDAAGSLLSTLRTAPACCGALRLSSPERALPLLVTPNAARLISTSLLDDLFFTLQLCTTTSLADSLFLVRLRQKEEEEVAGTTLHYPQQRLAATKRLLAFAVFLEILSSGGQTFVVLLDTVRRSEGLIAPSLRGRSHDLV
jgi:hypothetical protein